MLRVKAILRRGAAGEAPPREQVGPVRVDTEGHRVFVDGQEVELTGLEFKLLETFMARVGRVQTREQLARAEIEAAVDMVQRLESITEAALAHRSLDELLRGILERIHAAVEADTTVILLPTEDGAHLALAHAVGLAAGAGAGADGAGGAALGTGCALTASGRPYAASQPHGGVAAVPRAARIVTRWR